MGSIEERGKATLRVTDSSHNPESQKLTGDTCSVLKHDGDPGRRLYGVVLLTFNVEC